MENNEHCNLLMEMQTRWSISCYFGKQQQPFPLEYPILQASLKSTPLKEPQPCLYVDH